MGAFPSDRRAATLWVGVGEGGEELACLADRVVRATSGLGQEEVNRQFVSHLTVARFRTPINAAKLEVFPQLKQTELGMCEITRITLMESHLTPEGPRYEVLRDFPLG